MRYLFQVIPSHSGNSPLSCEASRCQSLSNFAGGFGLIRVVAESNFAAGNQREFDEVVPREERDVPLLIAALVPRDANEFQGLGRHRSTARATVSAVCMSSRSHTGSVRNSRSTNWLLVLCGMARPSDAGRVRSSVRYPQANAFPMSADDRESFRNASR